MKALLASSQLAAYRKEFHPLTRAFAELLEQAFTDGYWDAVIDIVQTARTAHWTLQYEIDHEWKLA